MQRHMTEMQRVVHRIVFRERASHLRRPRWRSGPLNPFPGIAGHAQVTHLPRLHVGVVANNRHSTMLPVPQPL